MVRAFFTNYFGVLIELISFVLHFFFVCLGDMSYNDPKTDHLFLGVFLLAKFVAKINISSLLFYSLPFMLNNATVVIVELVFVLHLSPFVNE